MYDHLSEVPVLSKHITARFIDGEAFLMNLESLKTYYLNETAAHVWSLIAGTKTYDEIVDELMEHYEISEADCRNDVAAIMELFVSEGLIEFTGKNAGKT